MPGGHRQDPNAPPPSRRARLIARLAFGAMATALGALALWGTVVDPVRIAIAARAWRPTPCRIVESALEPASGAMGGEAPIARLRYAYEWQGRHLVGARFDAYLGRYEAQRLVAGHPVGSDATCLVDPERPERAIVDPALRWVSIPFGLFAALFLALGVAALAAVPRVLRGPAHAAA